MRSVCVKSMMPFLILGFVFGATPALGDHLLDFQVMGSGTVETNCLATLYHPGCTITSWGEAQGTYISSPGVHGSFVLRLNTGSPGSLNGYPGGSQASLPQGVCVPASFLGRLTSTAGDIIDFSHAGTVCEETVPGSPHLYNGTYRIIGGTGQFTTAVGGGSLTATFTRDGTTAFFHLHGTIKY